MWVLEDWKDAEKVWYPVVWEEVKDASNVIDYNIRPEQTKDMSAEINANNQTTTGMATLIPWVNAPKLLAATSIVWIPEQEWSFYGTIVARSYTWTMTVPPWNSNVYTSEDTTIVSNTLPYDWSIDAKWLVIPKTWWYSIEVRYYTTWQSEFTRNDTVYIWDTVIWTNSWWSWTTTTYQVNANKWDTLRFKTYIYNSFPSTTVTMIVWVQYTITPK